MIKLICGRSKAGKTTYSCRFDNVIHLDFCGGISSCYDHASEFVAKANGDIIIEGVYNTAERRTRVLNAYNGDGEKVCIWIDTDIDTIASRTFDHVPKPRVFEPPTLDEGWDEIIIIKGDNDVECYRRQE